MIFRGIGGLFLCVAVWAETPRSCEALKMRGVDSQACYATLARSQDAFIRAEGLWGNGRFSEANDSFRAAVAQHSGNPDIRVRWGRLFLERFQRADAGALFEEALKMKQDHVGALLGMALLASNGFEKKAVEFAQNAVTLDPKSTEAHALLARLALEDSKPELAITEANKAIEIMAEGLSSPIEADRPFAITAGGLDAETIRAVVNLLANKPADEWFNKVFKTNPKYGQAYATAGYFLVINRRYEDGIRYYRKALEVDPRLWLARAELGVNLMRLGEDSEGRRNLTECFEAGYKSPEVVNSLRLLDSYSRFKTDLTPHTELRMDKKEDALLRPYFQTEMDLALATYEKKYGFKLQRPVRVEVYPNHEDFAVRTMGMPGLGALGVTFGYVVAMDSPSARKPGSFHWASTLWHELSHVYVLSATQHRVPRWFTEGLAVHEETAIHKDWGDRLDPEAIKAIKEKKLLPVADLDSGFIRPSYPMQVIVSYFQAGRICDYITEKWGFAKLNGMIHSYAENKTTPQAIEQNLGVKPEEFDKLFLAWLDERTKTTVANFDDWKKRMKVLAAAARDKKYDEVIKEGVVLRGLYPDYVESGNVYGLLADAYLEKGDKPRALENLKAYSETGGREPATIKKLAAMQVDAGQKKDAAATLERLNYIYPQDEELHRKLGDLLADLQQYPGAIREYQAVLASKPLDVAAAHYELARVYRLTNQKDQAKDEVLLALEAAPGFKAAQRLLLELDGK